MIKVMKNAVILHGGPSKETYYDPKLPSLSNGNWSPWLQKQLLVHDIPAATPEVPFAFERDWDLWTHEVERYVIGPETILVGHSTGAGYWVKYMCIHPELKVDRVVLVAPWLDPDRVHSKDFFEGFELDSSLPNRTKGISIFNSTNDEVSIHKTVEILQAAWPNVAIKNFEGYGHFYFGDIPGLEFPELLEEILREDT